MLQQTISSQQELSAGVQVAIRSFMLNSAVNPYIIGLFNSKFRAYVIGVVGRCFRKWLWRLRYRVIVDVQEKKNNIYTA